MNNSTNSSGAGPVLLRLEVKGIGAVPSFKNSKQIVRNRRTKVPLLITDPKKKKWMERAIQSLRSQLTSTSKTVGQETLMAAPPPCLTALLKHSMAFDDNRHWIPHLSVNGHDSKSDYAEIIVEELTQ